MTKGTLVSLRPYPKTRHQYDPLTVPPPPSPLFRVVAQWAVCPFLLCALGCPCEGLPGLSPSPGPMSCVPASTIF